MEHSMASPVAPATEPAAAPAGDSGQQASSSDDPFNFDAAFGLTDALKPATAAAESAPEASVGDSAPLETGDQPAEAESSKPTAEDTTEESASPRRGKAHEADRQAWADREKELRDSWESDRTRAEAAEREAAGLRTAEQERVRGYIARVGDDAEFNRLNSMQSGDMSYEDQAKLDNWKLNRVDLDLFQKDAFLRVANYQATEAQRVSTKPGVDPDVILKNPDFGAICEHFWEAGDKTARAELSDKIAQLEADNHALRAQRVGQARQPEAGGNSPPAARANPNSFDPNLSVDRLFDDAFGVPAQR